MCRKARKMCRKATSRKSLGKEEHAENHNADSMLSFSVLSLQFTSHCQFDVLACSPSKRKISFSEYWLPMILPPRISQAGLGVRRNLCVRMHPFPCVILFVLISAYLLLELYLVCLRVPCRCARLLRTYYDCLYGHGKFGHTTRKEKNKS